MPLAPPRSRQLRRADTHEVVFEVDQPIDANVLLRQALNAGVPLQGLNFTGLDLRGIPLAGEDLSGCVFCQTVIEGMDLTGCNLTGANLKWVRATGACFDGTQLDDARLDSAYLDATSFKGAKGRRVTFSCSELDHADFTGAVLRRAKFDLARLRCAVLERGDFDGADFRRAKMGHMKASNASFEDAGFGDASLWHGDFSRTWLASSRFGGADMIGINLGAARFGDAANLLADDAVPGKAAIVTDKTRLEAAALANVIGLAQISGLDQLLDQDTGEPLGLDRLAARSGWHDFITNGKATPDAQANDRTILPFPKDEPDQRPAYDATISERNMADAIAERGPTQPNRDPRPTAPQLTSPSA